MILNSINQIASLSFNLDPIALIGQLSLQEERSLLIRRGTPSEQFLKADIDFHRRAFGS